MGWHIALLLLLMCFPSPQLLAADAAEDSNSKRTLFDSSSDLSGQTEIILPIYIDGAPSGDIFAVIKGDPDNIFLDAQALIEALRQVLLPDVVERLGQLRDADDDIASRDLLHQGIRVAFDPDTVVLNVHTPLLARKERLLNLHSRQQGVPASASRAIPSAPVSAAVDLYMVEEWLRGDRRPISGEADAHVNLHGWVVQNRQVYNAGAKQRWQRRETRLTKDWPDQWQRLSIGDINYKSIGLMGKRPLSGFSLGTSFELQPYSVTYPLSRHEFFLEQDSQVDVYVNGSFRTRLQLDAGRHDILDLPLIQGINQVTLEITDQLGRTSSLEFFETLEQRLLRPGLDEYSFTLGVPYTTDTQFGIDYETETLALSTFYRTGLSEDLTVGGHLEITEKIVMGGATGVINGLWGTLSYDAALSRDSAADDTGIGVFVDYLFRRQGWSTNASYRWEGLAFANLNQSAVDNNTHYSTRVGFTFPRSYGWFCSLSVGQTRRWGYDIQRSQRLSLSRSYPYGWRVSLDFSRQNHGDEGESDVALRIYWAPSGSRAQGNLGYASLDHSRQTEVRYQRLGELGLDARALRLDSDSHRLDRLDASYVHPRLESRLSAAESHFGSSNSVDTQTLSFATALSYVDGYLAISRPLRGQPFALLNGKASLDDQTVNVIRGWGSRPSAVIAGAGATAVLPNLSPYYVNDVNLDVRDLPVGMQIEQESYNVLPGYRSGVLLQVGVDGAVYLTGRLLDPQGQPLGYAVGQLRGPNGVSAKSVLLFTDDQGHFEIAGLLSGRYAVQLDTHAYRGELDVPEEIFGRLDIGDVVLERR